jgi:hypothetical protein
MMTNNAKLRASIIETQGNAENIIQIAHNGNSYVLSDVKWVFDYVGPTGRISKEGLLRKPTNDDFTNIINNNLECRVQINEVGELILHYIQQPE